jgi:hypothetical protein
MWCRLEPYSAVLQARKKVPHGKQNVDVSVMKIKQKWLNKHGEGGINTGRVKR